MNQKGEALTIIAVTAAATLLVVSLIPNLDIFGKIFGGGSTPKAPTEEIWKEQTEEVIPRTGIVAATGEQVIAFEKRKTFRSGASKSPTKLSYGERIGEFFAGLTTFGLIVFIGLFLLFGITPAMVVNWFKNRKIKREEAMLAAVMEDKAKKEQALKNTVAALRDLPDEVWPKVRQLLEAKHDKQDRIVIDDIKKELH